jgi:hypothetical protein
MFDLVKKAIDKGQYDTCKEINQKKKYQLNFRCFIIEKPFPFQCRQRRDADNIPAQAFLGHEKFLILDEKQQKQHQNNSPVSNFDFPHVISPYIFKVVIKNPNI